MAHQRTAQRFEKHSTTSWNYVLAIVCIVAIVLITALVVCAKSRAPYQYRQSFNNVAEQSTGITGNVVLNTPNSQVVAKDPTAPVVTHGLSDATDTYPYLKYRVNQ